LTEADIGTKRKIAVVNQTLAAKFFPGQDPIGRRIKLTGLEQAPEPVTDPWFEIVGVASDLKKSRGPRRRCARGVRALHAV